MPPCSSSLDSFDFTMLHQAYPMMCYILLVVVVHCSSSCCCCCGGGGGGGGGDTYAGCIQIDMLVKGGKS